MRHHSELVFWAQTHACVLAPPSWLCVLVYVIHSCGHGVQLESVMGMKPAQAAPARPLSCAAHGQAAPAAPDGRLRLRGKDCAAAPSRRIHPYFTAPRQDVSIWAAEWSCCPCSCRTN